ncbi:MAG TPA: nitronate monooxygenase [Ilumatobacteraceae bacterium]|nr:nitronate monooxygenase [Ilumatobacteraceae bacterium]
MAGLPATITSRLRVPLVAAPMFQVSGPDLVLAACRAGAIGAFPTANCRSLDELDEWLGHFDEALGPADAPYCPNVIVRHAAAAAHVERICAHRAEVVITSVGSPAPVVGPLHDAGCLVLADVASVHHARRAVEAGADGLVLLTAGAGGQTGWANGFAFVRAVRRWFDGPVVLAGGVADGRALYAAQVLGCDLAYMGTRFIATTESMAAPAYKEMLVTGELDDVLLTSAISGLPTSILRPSLLAAGLDPDALPATISADTAAALYGGRATGPRRWRDIWSAGHAVSGVHDVPAVGDLVRRTITEYEAARADPAG